MTTTVSIKNTKFCLIKLKQNIGLTLDANKEVVIKNTVNDGENVLVTYNIENKKSLTDIKKNHKKEIKRLNQLKKEIKEKIIELENKINFDNDDYLIYKGKFDTLINEFNDYCDLVNYNENEVKQINSFISKQNKQQEENLAYQNGCVAGTIYLTTGNDVICPFKKPHQVKAFRVGLFETCNGWVPFSV